MAIETIPATINGWRVRALSAALSRAYAERGKPPPRYEATAPLGSICRASTIEALQYAISKSRGR